MSDTISINIDAAREFIAQAVSLQNQGVPEEVLRQNLISYLPRIFPSIPFWVDLHTRGAEAAVEHTEAGAARRSFIDNLVGRTSIEYERDLASPARFAEGYQQVRQHLAGQLNGGAPSDQLIGILSDTVRWRAYRVTELHDSAERAGYDTDDIVLDEVEAIDVTLGTHVDAQRLIEFLLKYLGREGSRQLDARTIADDLGYESLFCRRHLGNLTTLVERALRERPEFGDIIRKLWNDFVSYLGEESGSDAFDVTVYVSELYLVTLAKLLCANVIARRGLHSDVAEVGSILDGRYFTGRGLRNLVEYDYFGWLAEPPYLPSLIPIAEAMQSDLRAYDFQQELSHDLFGTMLARLALRTQRTLLGQEWTPEWLATEIAEHLIDSLPPFEPPRFIDPCCGSGALLLAVLRVVARRLVESGVQPDAIYDHVAQTSTGFDIDPLAVILARVNWVATLRDWLEPFDGSRTIVVPIYHADSLFGRAPLGDIGEGTDEYLLSLHDRTVHAPAFLITPQHHRFFDALLTLAYRLAKVRAQQAGNEDLEVEFSLTAAARAANDAGEWLSPRQLEASGQFLTQCVGALVDLQQRGLNGVWVFVLRNSYRPALVRGLFNGLISNPPWLALSKVSDNPYRSRLREAAAAYSISPPGSSHPHLDLATIFLLDAVRHYLQPGALVGCILPETVLNGTQHTPFRRGAFRRAAMPVDLSVQSLWRVATDTFKIEAIVLFGAVGGKTPSGEIPGQIAGQHARTATSFRIVQFRDRYIWSDTQTAEHGAWHAGIDLRQGADIMPRTTVFHDMSPAGPMGSDMWRIAPIDRSSSPLGYLINEGKKLVDFRVTPRVVPGRFIFDVFVSKHLVPFVLGEPAQALLPFERDPDGSWRPVPEEILALMPEADEAFKEILAAFDSTYRLEDYFDSMDTVRRKLSNQQFSPGDFLVVYGAGGKYPCAAYRPVDALCAERIIVDQTLYWTTTSSEDEALYITGIFNSDALSSVIQPFQPKGRFQERHVHLLPARATPEFHPSDSVHQCVVRATRDLLTDLHAALIDGEAASLLRRIVDPNGHLVTRRRWMREQIVQGLSAYAAYDAACQEVFAAAAEASTPHMLMQPALLTES